MRHFHKPLLSIAFVKISLEFLMTIVLGYPDLFLHLYCIF
jgi:hypothetical protein